MLKFSKEAPIYSFSSENLLYLINSLSDIKLNKNNALTIVGSGDQALILALLGYRDIDCVDINQHSLYYFNLKLAALKKFNFEQFKSFFLLNDSALSYSQYLHIHQLLSYEEQNFWDALYAQYDYDGKSIRESRYFNQQYDNNEEKIKLSYYLQNETIYKKIQSAILNSSFHFYQQDFISFLKEKEVKKNNYDCILLSNIADYTHKIYENDYLLHFKNDFVLLGLQYLNNHGIFMFAYIYDTQNVFYSNKRNIINDSIIRKQYFDKIKKTLYFEQDIISAIVGTPFDTACFLKKYD